MSNILINNKMVEDFEREVEAKKHLPLGRKILKKWILCRIDEKTIIFKKPTL